MMRPTTAVVPHGHMIVLNVIEDVSVKDKYPSKHGKHDIKKTVRPFLIK